MTKAARRWAVRPHVRDIAWARFPYERTGGRPADDMHPVVILQVLLDNDTGLTWVACAMGTSKLKLGDRDQIDAIVMNNEELVAMGLRCATRFNLDRIMWLPWDDQYFVLVNEKANSPVHARATETLCQDISMSFKIRRERGLWAPGKDGVPIHPPHSPDDKQPPSAAEQTPASYQPDRPQHRG